MLTSSDASRRIEPHCGFDPLFFNLLIPRNRGHIVVGYISFLRFEIFLPWKKSDLFSPKEAHVKRVPLFSADVEEFSRKKNRCQGNCSLQNNQTKPAGRNICTLSTFSDHLASPLLVSSRTLTVSPQPTAQKPKPGFTVGVEMGRGGRAPQGQMIDQRIKPTDVNDHKCQDRKESRL